MNDNLNKAEEQMNEYAQKHKWIKPVVITGAILAIGFLIFTLYMVNMIQSL